MRRMIPEQTFRWKGENCLRRKWGKPYWPQQRLYFLELPHQHISFLPVTISSVGGMVASVLVTIFIAPLPVLRRRGVETETGATSRAESSRRISTGTKLGIDATRKLAGERFKRPWPPLIRMSEDVRRKINTLFKSNRSS